MDIKEAYNQWADQYDTNENKTRDLEAISLQEMLSPLSFERCLEIGCGTGKNTTWLMQKAKFITAVDFSDEMLSIARKKIHSDVVQFVQADITTDWHFVSAPFDIITFSLVLEHIENVTSVLQKTYEGLKEKGYLYIGELHPFKQYGGSKARFETAEGTKVVTCFTHHFSDFISAAKMAGLKVIDIKEYFDEDDRTGVPRILSILFQKE